MKSKVLMAILIVFANLNANLSDSLFGNWKIISYKFDGISAIGEEEANENYLGKIIIYSKNKIQAFYDTCYSPNYHDTLINSAIYLIKEYKANKSKLNITKDSLKIIQIECKDNNRFGEVFWISKMKIIVPLEGVFFILKRQNP